MKIRKTLFAALALISATLPLQAQITEKVDTLRASRVTAEKRTREASTQTGLQRLDEKKINRGFALFNTPDIIKTLQMMPGVAAGTELMSGLYVHGGDGSDNLFLLDGVPIYQISHVGGLFSAFNSDVVETLDFYKSGFPARYGGRASSVVDVHTREGNFEKFKGTFALGLVDGRFQIEGPLVKGRTSFNLGIRRSWSEVVTVPALIIANRQEVKENGKDEANHYQGGYNFTDFNFGITHKFTEDNRLRLNFYWGDDRMPFTIKMANSAGDGPDRHYGYDAIKAKLFWGNTLTSLNWQYDITDKFYLDATAYHSRNRNVIDLAVSMWEWDGKDVFSSIGEDVTSVVSVSGLKANFHYKPTPGHHIRFGAMAQYNHYTPGRTFRTDLYRPEGNLVNEFTNKVVFDGGETALFAEDEFNITERLKANIGARGVFFLVRGGAFPKFEPRAALKFQCTAGTSLRLSYAEMNQFDHSIATSYIDLPTNTWMPSTASIKPIRSRQVAGGVYSTLPHNIKVTVEGWYKTMDNLYEYGGITSLYPPIDTWETDFVPGKGKSWGMETSLEYENEKLSASLYYTLSWSLRKFEAFYYDWYPDRNDNRHKIDLLLNYRFTPKFELYAGWHYHTGSNMTAATYMIQRSGERSFAFEVYDRPNSLKIPDYHRLDLGLNWTKTTRRGNTRILNFSIYNAYNRLNPMFANIEEEYEHYMDPETGYYRSRSTGKWKGTAIGIIPIIPTIGYTLKF